MKEGDSLSGLLSIFSEEGYNKDISIRIGVITSVSPFKVKINNGIELDLEDVVLSRTFKNQLEKKDIYQTSTEDVEIDDEVIGILDEDEYYILDRL